VVELLDLMKLNEKGPSLDGWTPLTGPEWYSMNGYCLYQSPDSSLQALWDIEYKETVVVWDVMSRIMTYVHPRNLWVGRKLGIAIKPGMRVDRYFCFTSRAVAKDKTKHS
jgi:hypothetical protein